MTVALLVIGLVSAAAVLLLDIAGQATRPDHVDLTWQERPLDYWYPPSLVDLAEQRHTDALTARVHAALYAPTPVMGMPSASPRLDLLGVAA